MEPIVILLVFVTFILAAWFIGTYNKFIKYKNSIEVAWSGIDVALKRRFNLIPNLIRAIEAYGDHEAAIFQTKGSSYAKETSGVSTRVEQESHVSDSLRGLLALAEAYPDLKSSANFLDLQNSLDEIEADIQKARNGYNRTVGRFNTLIESFPALYIARKFGFTKKSYFTLDLITQREVPEVNFSPPVEK
jgi:LemA protein